MKLCSVKTAPTVAACGTHKAEPEENDNPMKKFPRTAIESLESRLRKRVPTAELALDRPDQPDGTWFLDVELDGHAVEVIWRGDRGFGVSSSIAHTYGDGADEVYADVEAAYARILSLLLSRTFTAPPVSVRIAELRKERGVTQERLAEALDVRQATVSKLEHRNDVLVSTLRDVVQSMGGELRIVACFPDGMERTLQIGGGSDDLEA